MAGNDTPSHQDFSSDASRKHPSTTTMMSSTALAAEVGREAGGIKRIYMIEGWSFEDFSFQCFVLNMENGEETTLTISPASDKDRIAIHWNFSVVALGSLIYLIGGQCLKRQCPDGLDEGSGHPHPHVRYFDICKPEKGWKLGVPMHTGRALPAAAVIDGKIYAIGGCLNQNSATDKVFGECFDPKTNKWRLLTLPAGYEPTHYVQTQVPYVVDRDGKKSILINTYKSKETLYEYHLIEKKWSIVDQTFKRSVNQGAILDHILYTVWRNAQNPLFGFDLIHKEWIPVHVKLPKLNRLTTSVFHLGGDKLCLVWHRLDKTRMGQGHSKYVKVECLELKLNNSSASGKLKLTATQESYHYFYVSSGSSRQIFLPM